MASLKETLTALADAIRKRSGKTEKMTLAEMPAEVAALPSGGRDDELISGDFKDGTYENDSVTKIKNYAFCNIQSLKSVSFKNVTSVGYQAFYRSYNLQKISFPNLAETYTDSFAETAIESVKMEKLQFIGNNVFNQCENLKSVSCPIATSVGYQAFSYCRKLEEIYLPSVTSIGGYAFSYYLKITNVSFPNLNKIANGVFQYCQNLTSLSIGSNNTNSICSLESSNAFSHTPIESGTGYIYVPDALVDQYKSATNWSVYANQIKGLSEKPAE